MDRDECNELHYNCENAGDIQDLSKIFGSRGIFFNNKETNDDEKEIRAGEEWEKLINDAEALWSKFVSHNITKLLKSKYDEFYQF